MDIIKAFLDCIGGYTDCGHSVDHLEARSLREEEISTQDTVNEMLKLLFSAKERGHDLEQNLKDIVHKSRVREYGWPNIYVMLFNSLQKAIEKGTPMGQAMEDAISKASHAAVDFAKEHPMFCAILAIGVLVILAPWILEALGFGVEGPIAGTFAARWQSLYKGYVHRRSLFSYLQRLGMKWGSK